MVSVAAPEKKITQAEKQSLFTVLMRSPAVFNMLRSVINPEMFSIRDVLYAVTWRTLCDCWDKYGCLPDKEILKTALQSEIERAPGLFHGDDLSDFDDFIDVAYEGEVPDDAKYWDKYVKALVQKFVTESVAHRASEMLVSAKPSDVAGIFSKFSEDLTQISTFSSGTASTLCFGDDWQPTVLALSDTGVTFLNKLLDGGQAAGEVYGLVGPYGSCKSTLAVQIVCAAARMQNGIPTVDDKSDGYMPLMSAKEDPEDVVNYLVSYEDGTDLLYSRILGNLAEVHVKSISLAGNLENLTRKDNLKPYEKLLNYNLPKPRYGEYERLALWKPLARRHICAMDFTGQSEVWKGCGAGGVPEIVQQIQRDLQNRPTGTRVGVVVIDYCGAMVDRNESLRIRTPSDRAYQIKKSVLDVKHQIGVRFGCPVYFLHQLSGSANNRRSGSVASQGDAEGSKSWPEHLVYSFVIGKPDANNRTIIDCQKHRRSAPTGRCILAIEGEFCRSRDISDAFCVQSGSKIVAKEDLGVQVMSKAVKRHSNLSNLDQG